MQSADGSIFIQKKGITAKAFKTFQWGGTIKSCHEIAKWYGLVKN